MTKRKDLLITHDLIVEIETKLRQSEGENYKGLLSVSCYLVNLYFENYLERVNEYSFFVNYKALEMSVDLMQWLGEHYHEQIKPKFDFKKSIQQANHILNPIRKKLLFIWQVDNLKIHLQDKQYQLLTKEEDQRLEFYIQMLQDLIVRYPEYSNNQEKEFKKDIGLE
jgi:hypothetical protein